MTLAPSPPASGLVGARSVEPRYRTWLAALFPVVALLILCRKVIAWALTVPHPPIPGDPRYNYAILAPNYANAGFVRRGLGGALMAPFETGSETSLIGFHVVCAVWLVVPLALLVRRLVATPGARGPWLVAVLLLAPQVLLAWSIDVGKGDMLVAGFIGWAVLAALDRRYALATAILAAGFLAHETVIFFGVPIVAVVWYLDWRAGRATLRDGLVAAGGLVALLAAIVVAQAAFSATPAAIARLSIEGHPRTLLRYYATYMTMAGMRTMTTSWCVSFAKPHVVFDLVVGFVFLCSYAVVLAAPSRRSLVILAVVALVPMIAISVVAIDYGRWLSFAVMAAWFGAAVIRLRAVDAVDATGRRYAAAVAALIVLLLLGPSSIFDASRVTRRVADRIWPASGDNLARLFDRCDPDWRRVIGYRAPEVE